MTQSAAGSAPVSQGQGPIRERTSDERENLAERIADRLDVPITAAGVIFLLLVLAETISNPQGIVGTLFSVTSWVLWALFVGEFVLRMFVAPSTSRFLKRNWWQLIFLAVPALRFVRALRALRAARMGRVLSSAVRAVQVVVITYSVVVFAALAGTLGAFLLERRDDDDLRLRVASAQQETGRPLSSKRTHDPERVVTRTAVW